MTSQSFSLQSFSTKEKENNVVNFKSDFILFWTQSMILKGNNKTILSLKIMTFLQIFKNFLQSYIKMNGNLNIPTNNMLKRKNSKEKTKLVIRMMKMTLNLIFLHVSSIWMVKNFTLICGFLKASADIFNLNSLFYLMLEPLQVTKKNMGITA